MDVEELLEVHSKLVIDRIKAVGSIMPMVIGTTSGNESIITLMPFRNEKEKYMMQSMVRIQFLAMDVVSYINISEIWYNTRENMKEGLMISETKNKKEGIMIMAITDSEVLGRVYQIIRGESGKIIDVVKTDLMDMKNNIRGALAEFLPPKELRTPENKKQALKMLSGFGYELVKMDDQASEFRPTIH